MDRARFELLSGMFLAKGLSKAPDLTVPDRAMAQRLEAVMVSFVPDQFCREDMQVVLKIWQQPYEPATVLTPTPVEFQPNADEHLAQALSGLPQQSPGLYLGLIISTLAALIVERTKNAPIAFERSQLNYATAIDVEKASYLAWSARLEASAEEENAKSTFQQLNLNFQSFVDDARKTMSVFSDEIASRQSAFSALTNQTNTASEAVSAMLRSTDTSINKTQAQISDLSENASRIANFVKESADRINAIETSVTEDAAQRSGRDLWDKRAAANTRAFWVTTAALGALLIVIPALAIYYDDAVIDALMKINSVVMRDLPPNPTAAQLTMAALNRLLIIAFPIGLYLWTIRILVRLNMHSLLMANDAQQRRTIMQTYIHLIRNDFAQKEDRALLLNALFRPPPGQVNDSVEPPSFTDLIDKMKGMGG